MALGLDQPKPDEEGLAPPPGMPPLAPPLADPNESNLSCSFLKDGKFRGGGTESFGPALWELLGLERTTIPPPPPPPPPDRARLDP